MSGLFIAFEGGEGAGKSTQAGLLDEALRQRGYYPVLVREPGSTPLGEHLREYLVAGQPITPPAELLLFEAARAELMARRIAPDLADGAVVIVDRFAGSTVAYQGHGRGLDLERIKWLNDFATRGRYPDLTLLLDIDPAIGLNRVQSRQLSFGLLDADADRFEDADIAFHSAVRRGFQEQAAADPAGWQVIQGNHAIPDVATAVWRSVSPLLAGRNLRRESV
ncbi:MAG: dTMP kinase [Chloroflexi bacterium]|nr:dTMP kinase [Chloroflexota bacterium]MYD47946.1 dTMP kinase [Chloroflexota bacterium]